jgi:hypothetical protein
LQLVFLHIPKSAGTSQRRAFNNFYGTENVWWVGVDCNSSAFKLPALAVKGKMVIGGHKGIRFYPKKLDALYCGVVRDPVDRVISLFGYYTNPGGAADEHARIEREKQLKRMIENGIDPDSLYNSLRNCKIFIDEIKNTQCKYLCRSEPKFGDALATLQSNNFVIGSTELLHLYENEMSMLLGWDDPSKMVAVNQSKPNANKELYDDHRVIELIREVSKEDQKLYEYITKDCGGLYKNVSQDASKEILLRSRTLIGENEKSIKSSSRALDRWRSVSIYTKGGGLVVPDKDLSVLLLIENRSDFDIGGPDSEEVQMCYKMQNSQGYVVSADGIRTSLDKPIISGETARVMVTINIPEVIFSEADIVEFSLIVKDQYWVSDFYPLHVCWLKLVKA